MAGVNDRATLRGEKAGTWQRVVLGLAGSMLLLGGI